MATSFVTIGGDRRIEGDLGGQPRQGPDEPVLSSEPVPGSHLAMAKPGAGIPSAVAEVVRSMLDA